MQDLKNDRLFVAFDGLIFQCMKKAMFQLPTAEELYALEKRARRERSMYVAALNRPSKRVSIDRLRP